MIACPGDVLADWFLGGDDDGDCSNVDDGLGFDAIEVEGGVVQVGILQLYFNVVLPRGNHSRIRF